MKTARELLLKRHRSIEPKLDALRAKTVSALRESATELPVASAKTSLRIRIWQELILPARRLWLGMAAAWCLIVLLHASAPSPKPLLNAQAPRPALEMIMVFQYPDSSAVAELKPVWKDRAPGPRSERNAEEATS